MNIEREMEIILPCNAAEIAMMKDLLQHKVDNINANRTQMLWNLNWKLDLCSYQHNLNGFWVEAIVDDGEFCSPVVQFIFKFFTDGKQYLIKGKPENCERVSDDGWLSLEEVVAFSTARMFSQEALLVADVQIQNRAEAERQIHALQERSKELNKTADVIKKVYGLKDALPYIANANEHSNRAAYLEAKWVLTPTDIQWLES
jgi:hypothetical protein